MQNSVHFKFHEYWEKYTIISRSSESQWSMNTWILEYLIGCRWNIQDLAWTPPGPSDPPYWQAYGKITGWVRPNYSSDLIVIIIKVLTCLLFIKNGLKGKEMPCKDFKLYENFKVSKNNFWECFKCFFILCFYITNLLPI